AVALFVDEWYAPADVKWYEFPSTVQPEEPPVDEDEYAVEPAAVWCGDFKTAEKGGYTLSTSGTTAIADDTYGSTLTIGDAAAVIDVSAANTNELTVLVKYTAAPGVTSAPVVAFGGMAGKDATVGLDVGAYTKADKTLAVYRNFSTDNGKPYEFASAPVLSATGGYLLCARDNVQGFRAYVGESLDSMTGETLSNANIKFSNVPLTKIGIGGGSSLPANVNDMVPFAGFVVEKIAVFKGYYTPRDLIPIENPEDAATLSIADNVTWNFAAGETRTYESIGTLAAGGTIAVTNETLAAGVYKLAEWTTAQKKSTGYGYVGTLSTPGLVPGLTAELVYGAKAIYLRVYDATAQAAKGTLKIWPYGDSITEGFNAGGTRANYRVLLGQKLSMLGYNVEMVGCYDKINGADAIDPSGQVIPDAWKWHSAKHGATAGPTTSAAGRANLCENVDTLCAQAGNPDVVLLLAGANDIVPATGLTAQQVVSSITNIVAHLAANLPNAKIVVGNQLNVEIGYTSYNYDHVTNMIPQVNTRLKSYVDDLPTELSGRVFLADLNSYVKSGEYGILFDQSGDHLHPDWWGHDQMAEGWLSVITNQFTSTQFFPSATIPEAPAAEELGAAAKSELDAYREGFALARTIDVANMNAPSVVDGEGVKADIEKVGYFVEYVRADNNAHKWVWVDMDAFGTTIADVGLPAANHQQVVARLHVKSNHNGIDDVAADDDTVTGFVEFSPCNYGGNASGVTGAPADYGSCCDWNDALSESGTYGCMQVHRIFSPAKSAADGVTRGGEVLFAYNNWQSDSTAAEFGIGNFSSHFYRGASDAQTLDYTYTANATQMNAAAYRVKRIEIWTKASPVQREVYYKSGYWGTGGNTSLAVTLADGTATTLREGDTIVIDDKSSTDIYFGPLPDYANKIRVSRNVVFSSGANVPAMLDGAEISVDDDCAVTIKRQWNDITLGSFTIDSTSAITLDNNGQSLTIGGTLTCNAPITIDSGKTVSVGASGSLAGTYSLSGAGTLAFAAMPDSALSFGSWTGTVELPAFQAAGQTLTDYVVNGTSKLKLGGITGGYLMWNDLDFRSELILAGDFILSDMSERSYSFAKISGTGNISLTPGTYALTAFTIGEYSATGAVTNNMPNTAIAITTLALPSNASVVPGTKLLATGGTGAVNIGTVTVGGVEQTNLAYLKRDDGIYVVVTPENIDTCDASSMTDDEVAELVFTVTYTPDGGTEMTANYTGILAKDANGEVALNPLASVDGVSVRPELDDEAEAAYDASGEKLKVKAIPGLWYQTIYGDALTGGGVGGTIGATTPVQAKQKALTLEAPKEGAVRFYQIRVAPKKQ
ncbi:MAG: hypothetical protein II909_00575, partial [Kiritimatiellae bacterium]|nr:hypothetical protein [Kiritimatiellia bacterium]